MTAPLPPLTAAQQAAIFDQNIDAAVQELAVFCMAYAHKIKPLARQRLLGIGIEQYGDKMFHQTPQETERETLEELADAANRLVVKQMRYG